MNRVRRGYTLVELLVAMGILAVVFYVLFRVVLSGATIFTRGMATARGPEQGLLLLDRMERDLLQALQTPGDPRAPVSISADRRTLCYYRPDPEATGPNTVVGRPCWWGLAPDGQGRFHPVRDGEVLRSVVVTDWGFTLLSPDRDERRHSWMVAVDARLYTGSRLRPEFVAARLMLLLQPTSNFLYFPESGALLPPDLVSLPLHPMETEGFDLGPPRIERAGEGEEVP